MAIPQPHAENFQTLQDAVRTGDCALLECTNAKTGEPEYVICVVNHFDGEYQLLPIAKMLHDPFNDVLPPEV